MSRLEKLFICIVFFFFVLIIGSTLYSFYKVKSYQDNSGDNDNVASDDQVQNPVAKSPGRSPATKGFPLPSQAQANSKSKSKSKSISSGPAKPSRSNAGSPTDDQFSPFSFSSKVKAAIGSRNSDLLEHIEIQHRKEYFQRLKEVYHQAKEDKAPIFTSQQTPYLLLPTVAFVSKKWASSFDRSDIIKQNQRGLLVDVSNIPNQIPRQRVVLNQSDHSLGVMTGKIIMHLKEDQEVSEFMHDFPQLQKIYEMPSIQLYIFNTPENYDIFNEFKKMQKHHSIANVEFEIIVNEVVRM